jgi:hypothetical protein
MTTGAISITTIRKQPPGRELKWKRKMVQLHLAAGEACGRLATCGTKVNHGTEESAAKAAASLNRSGKARHEVEPYPCFWCKGWHVGRKMSAEELLK